MAKSKPPADSVFVPQERAPGEINAQELGILYDAAKIELRAAREQADALGAFVARVMEQLGVGNAEAALARIAELTANREQRRRAPTKKPRGRRKA